MFMAWSIQEKSGNFSARWPSPAKKIGKINSKSADWELEETRSQGISQNVWMLRLKTSMQCFHRRWNMVMLWWGPDQVSLSGVCVCGGGGGGYVVRVTRDFFPFYFAVMAKSLYTFCQRKKLHLLPRIVASLHKAKITVSSYLDEQNVHILTHTPCGPDFVPCFVHFLFFLIFKGLVGQKFSWIENLSKFMISVVRALPDLGSRMHLKRGWSRLNHA